MTKPSVKRALTESTQCCGFTTKGHRRCRLERQSNSLTCYIHRNYYRDWSNRNEPLVLYENLSKREREEYEFQLKHRYVYISEQQVIQLTEYQRGYFEVFMKYTDHSSSLNQVCLNDIFSYSVSRRQYEDSANYMELYLKDADSCICLLDICMRHLIWVANGDPEAYIDFLKHYTLPESWRQLLFSTSLEQCFLEKADYIRRNAPYAFEVWDPFHIQMINGLVHLFIKLFNSHHSNQIKKRCAIFKEELVATAWRPSRVEAWVEAGMNLEDL
jgi:hypothetical protein